MNPFIIEEVPSAVSSTQLYQQQLIRSDIVVLLVKGEVRKGTAIEYALASKHKKPLLVYFLEDGSVSSLSVAELKSDIQTTDYCTYCQVKSFDDIEVRIKRDVIQDVIRHYQISFLPELDLVDVADTTMPIREDAIKGTWENSGVPTKTALSQFSSCYGHIFALLLMRQEEPNQDVSKSPFHDFGERLIEWFINGAVPSCDADILRLIEELTPVFGNTEWLKKRWDAIRYEWVGDLQSALAAERQALEVAKTEQMPQWIINNILIDCRNIENEINQHNCQPLQKNEAQEELNGVDTAIYLPVLDRYLGNVYESVHKEKLKRKTAKPGTRFLGSNFETTINGVENYFFSAVLYGSYSHMVIARELLFNALWGYSEIFEDEQLLLSCIKLLVLKGNSKCFKQTLDAKWDAMCASVVSAADELWNLAAKAPLVHQDDIRQAVLMKLGMYFSDEAFLDAQRYLAETADEIYWGNAENYLDCIVSNMNRLSSSMVVAAISGIIREQRFHLGDKMSRVLLQIHLETVDNSLQVVLRDALAEKLTFIVSNGGTPQFIAALARQNPDVFSCLADAPDNGLVGTEKVFYELNMGYGNWGAVLSAEIQTAKDQFEANKDPGKHIRFFENPYATIKMVVREHYNPSMDALLLEQFIPLCTEVLSSQIEAGGKNDCIDTLCEVLICSEKCKESLPAELIKAISTEGWEECCSVWSGSNDGLSCRVLLLRIFAGVADKEELIEWCFAYSKKEREERIVLSKCIEQYLRNCPDVYTHADATVLSIAIQCLEDADWIVRKYACNSMAMLLESQYKPLVERKLYEVALDPSPYVRNHILRLCKDGCIKDAGITAKLAEMLQQDANYAIRRFAEEHVKDFKG